MFDRITSGWALVKESWQMLRTEKQLLLFPAFSAIACLMVMASFAIPLIVSPTVRDTVLPNARVEGSRYDRYAIDENLPIGEHEDQPIALSAQYIVPALVGFAFYLATSFVIVFFNTALVSCVLIRFNGGEPTIGDGINAAMARLPQILGWALLTAIVGTVLKQIEDRVPLAGKLIVSLIGMAWAAVTFMVVPILAAEGCGPLAAVKRSASLLRKTWGESLVGHVSLSSVQLLFMLPVIAGARSGRFLDRCVAIDVAVDCCRRGGSTLVYRGGHRLRHAATDFPGRRVSIRGSGRRSAGFLATAD